MRLVTVPLRMQALLLLLLLFCFVLFLVPTARTLSRFIFMHAASVARSLFLFKVASPSRGRWESSGTTAAVAAAEREHRP